MCSPGRSTKEAPTEEATEARRLNTDQDRARLPQLPQMEPQLPHQLKVIHSAVVEEITRRPEATFTLLCESNNAMAGSRPDWVVDQHRNFGIALENSLSPSEEKDGPKFGGSAFSPAEAAEEEELLANPDDGAVSLQRSPLRTDRSTPDWIVDSKWPQRRADRTNSSAESATTALF